MGAARDIAHHHGDEVGVVAPRAKEDLGDPAQLLVGRLVRRSHLLEADEQVAPVLAEERREHLLLGREVVVEQAVGDARLLGDVADARGVVALAREDADGRLDDEAALLLAPGLALAGGALRAIERSVKTRSE